jgi:hypothetical protein
MCVTIPKDPEPICSRSLYMPLTLTISPLAIFEGMKVVSEWPRYRSCVQFREKVCPSSSILGVEVSYSF